MPLYDLICLKCGYTTEKMMTFKEEPPCCPDCGMQLERGAGSIAFFRMKDDIQGSTRGTRMKAEEITRKSMNK